MEILPVFVYGTLRRGERNHGRYLYGKTVAEMPATLKGYRMYGVGTPGIGYPAIIPSPGFKESQVVGEVMWLDGRSAISTMIEIDYLEGFYPKAPNSLHNMYYRKKERVNLRTGGTVETWVYVWNRDGEKLDYFISGGDWKKREKRAVTNIIGWGEE